MRHRCVDTHGLRPRRLPNLARQVAHRGVFVEGVADDTRTRSEVHRSREREHKRRNRAERLEEDERLGRRSD